MLGASDYYQQKARTKLGIKINQQNEEIWWKRDEEKQLKESRSKVYCVQHETPISNEKQTKRMSDLKTNESKLGISSSAYLKDE